MNGNALFHAVGLAFTSLLLLPLPLLVLTGRTPAWLRARVAEPRWPALAMIGFWLPAPLNAVPRILDAGTGVVLAFSAAGMLCGFVGVAFFLRAAWAAARAPRTGRRG
ncbi:hypothetical protein [Streptomyces goshikiensis]|uniref:hypothetical protein n=1 Tax=Streptomyces goshikiensis TaxID=1942 RepID=UPI00365DA22B